MIKYSSTRQLSIEEFRQPFGKLGKDNRWVILANLLPWDDMARVYAKRMSQKLGRKAVNPRIAVGTLIIKHILRSTDEDTIELIKESPYLQYFLGYPGYRYEQPFTASLLVAIRRRLGVAEFEQLTAYFMNQVNRIGQQIASQKKNLTAGRADSGPAQASRGTHSKADPSGNSGGGHASDTRGKSADSQEPPPKPPASEMENKGHLIVDATVAPADIKYPTDLDLLNEAREKSEQLIDLLYVPEKGKTKPRTYRKKARQAYLACAKQRKKRKRALKKALKAQLNYLGRNLRTIGKLLDRHGHGPFPLADKYQQVLWVLQEVYRQQKQMYDDQSHKTPDRIVNIAQPHIRPIVRGKAGKEVEFGAKISVSLVDGYSYLDRISWDAYNEGTDLKAQIEAYRERFGCYPEWVSADAIYGSRENRAYMKEHKIKYTGHALGRPPGTADPEHREHEAARKQQGKQRSRVEGIFGNSKRKYDLDLVKAKTKETSESWIAMVYLVMNIAHFLRVIFWPILKLRIFWLKRITKMLLTDMIPFNIVNARYRSETF